MNRISLLPPEIREREVTNRRWRITVMISAAVIILFLLGYGGLIFFTFSVRSQVRDLHAERAAVVQKAAQYQRYADLQSAINKLHNLVRQAVGATPDYAAVLSGIGVNLPEGVWLTDLTESGLNSKQNGATDQNQTEVNSNNKEGQLKISGGAYRHTDVAKLIVALQNISGIDNILCQSSAVEDNNGQSYIKFEINAGLPVNSIAAGKNKGGV